MNRDVRIAVLGAGAIGSAVGALLAREGHDVTLVARPDQVQAVRDRGLRMDGVLGTFTVSLRTATVLESAPEVALLAVKTQDLEGLVRANRAHLDDVPVVTMQNGVQSDRIVANLLPSENLLSSVVVVTATYLIAGHVTLVDRGHLILGRPQGPRDDLVNRIAEILNPAVPTSISDNIVGCHWFKLLMNLNNAIPALTNLPLREVAHDPFLGRLAVSLMREGLRVSDRAGISLAPLAGVSVGTVRLLTRLPMPLAARMFASRAGSLGGEWPILGSTLQSLRRGRTTEIDYLNGEIARRGADLGVSTPLNTKVVELVHGVERTGRFYEPRVLRAILRSVGMG